MLHRQRRDVRRGRRIAAATALVGFELTSPARTLGATYHADAAAQCIAQMTAAVPGCGAGTLEGAGWASACSSVYTGTKKPGESCTSSVEQCAPVTGGTVSCVAWTAAIPGPDGGSSSQTGQSCQVHLPGVAGLICRSPQNAPPSTTVYDCDPATNNGLTCNEQSGTCEVRVAPEVLRGGYRLPARLVLRLWGGRAVVRRAHSLGSVLRAGPVRERRVRGGRVLHLSIADVRASSRARGCL